MTILEDLATYRAPMRSRRLTVDLGVNFTPILAMVNGYHRSAWLYVALAIWML